MDSLLLVGAPPDRMRRLLVKLGYRLIEHAGTSSIPEVVRSEAVDLILIDESLAAVIPDLCEFFRAEPGSRQIPIVCLADSMAARLEVERAKYPLLDCLPAPTSPGLVVSRIATQIRMRKIAGEEKGLEATLAEMNATLRDHHDRFSRELAEARAIQQALLPGSLPTDPRFSLAASYDPLEELGGDWYFVGREPSGRLSIQIADVTGHGLSAAFVCSMTRLAMSAAPVEEPHLRLKEMNRLMSGQLPEGRFVTMAGVLYDPDSGRLVVARAGHPPALLIDRTAGQVRHLGGDGFPIGFVEECDYTPEEATLARGDCLVLLTDGVTEAQNRSRQMYGLNRMGEVLLAAGADLSAGELTTRALRDFNTWRDGRKLKDDITLVVLKRS